MCFTNTILEKVISIGEINANSSIKCSADKCKYHAQLNNYFTLQEIEIGTHKANFTKIKCTDCEPFQVK